MLNTLKDTPYINELYLFYNGKVFAGMPSVKSAIEAGEEYTGSIAEALLAIRLADSDAGTGTYHILFR